MPIDRRSFRAPFVLTVAAIAAAPVACGGNADAGGHGTGGTDAGTSGAAGSGIGGTSGAAGSGIGGTGANPPGFGGTAGSSGDGGTAGTGGYAGYGGTAGTGGYAGYGGSAGYAGTSGTSGSAGAGGAPDCPAGVPAPFETCVVGIQCSLDVDCQSGPIALTFTCGGDATYSYWQIESQPCVEDFDSCAGTELYCSGEWWMPQGTNPPAPCPDVRPGEGDSCYAMAMGGVHEQCGYRCAGPNTPWTVATCTGAVGDAGIWEGHWAFDDACSPGG